MAGGPVRWLRAGMAGWALAVVALPAWALPTFDEVLQDHRSSEVLVLSREGEVLQHVPPQARGDDCDAARGTG